MSKGYVVIFDDMKSCIDDVTKYLKELAVDLDVVSCDTLEKLRAALSDKGLMGLTRVLIFDLAVSEGEIKDFKFAILADIEEKFNTYRIPIFIHSAFAEHVENFKGYGTVFKVTKGADSVKQICTKIKLFLDSGLLETFCPGGIVENVIMQELHRSFTEQFKNNELEEILSSIEKSGIPEIKKRTEDVLLRIAIRSLFQNLMNSCKNKEDEIKEIELNAIEHYYRRKPVPAFMTGDAFVNKKTKENAIVITPRCNIVNKNYNQLLLCNVRKLTGDEIKGLKRKQETFRRALNSDVTLDYIKDKSGYLIQTPLFEGGLIDFNSIFSIDEKTFLAEYEYKISLSEELTNEIVRKLSAYISRGGISNTHLAEALYYIGAAKK
ncbi:MAG: hypothetical protein PHH68_05445 [Candidatus Omnitrophica bacterium]|nr:hypothetical protein [Candidatus Omnitrophota bacterium]